VAVSDGQHVVNGMETCRIEAEGTHATSLPSTCSSHNTHTQGQKNLRHQWDDQTAWHCRREHLLWWLISTPALAVQVNMLQVH
jgi:hypothetical protein